MFIEFFVLASECETIDNGSNSHSSQLPNSSTKPTNIRPQSSRIPSEQLSISTESMTNTKTK